MPQGSSLKSMQAVCMTVHLPRENTHSSAWDLGVSEAPRNRDWISKRRLQKPRASVFIFNELLNGTPRTECCFFLAMLLPTHLRKTRRFCRNSSLRAGWGSSDRAQTLCPHPDFRPNSEGGSCKQFPKSEVGSARGLHFSRAQSQSSHALSGFDRDLRAGR